MSRLITAAIVAASICLTALAQPAASPPAATQPTTQAVLAQLIAAIRDAQHAQTAIAAYGRAKAIDPLKTEIYEAHMLRLLKFGLPQVAYYPAQELAALDAGKGTAWAVIGYMAGKKGDFGEAFEATMRAAELIGDDVSVQHNAGQLAAWYDGQSPPPKVSDLARRILDKSRQKLSAVEPFAKGYAAVSAAQQRQALIDLELATKVAAARAREQAVEAKLGEYDRQLRDLADSVAYQEDLIASLHRELVYGSYYSYYHYPWPQWPDGLIRRPYHVPYDYYLAREQIRRRILEEQRTLDALRLQQRAVRREAEPIVAELERTRTDLAQLYAQRRAQQAGLEAHYRWDPPMVEGKVWPEIQRIPPGPAEAKKLPEDPNRAAAWRLQLAQLYLENNLQAKGEDILREIVEKYPQTSSAEAARKMLQQLGAMPK